MTNSDMKAAPPGARRRASSKLSALGAALFASLLPGAHAQTVDPSTMAGKVLAGYQGWFRCPGDGSPGNNWSHWTSNNEPITLTNMTVDDYPDVTGMDASSTCAATPFTLQGKTAYLFTSFALQTEETHFSWMREYGIDGVLDQRFISDLGVYTGEHERVLTNIMTAAQDNGRVFAVEYDLSGARNNRTDDEFMAVLEQDWLHLVNDVGITKSPAYLHQGGRPLVSLWGIGMNNSNYVDDAALGQRIISWFHDVAHVSVMAGVSSGWTTPGQNGSASGDGWPAVYAQFDAIQPWPVGKYNDIAGANYWKQTELEPDIAVTAKNHQIYMPVILPGSADHNGNPSSPKNATPRLGGTFFWQQAVNARSVGAVSLKIAMFDEVNESTAIFKVAPTAAQAPDQGYWLTLDADGDALPSDWYLRLAYEIQKGFNSATLSSTMPSNPWVATAQNCGVLASGQSLLPGQAITSCDGRSQLIQQLDGNLVAYRGGTPVWATGTVGQVVVETTMQPDGNLVEVGAGNKIIWSSDTQGSNGAFVRMQDDGVAAIIGSQGVVRSTQ